MRTIEILQQNPAALEAMRKWHHAAMIEEASKELPKEFIEELKKMVIENDTVESITDGNARNWFDFFDENKIYIDIKSNFDGTFMYALLDGDVSNLGSLDKFNTRKEADKAAVWAAIVVLENKLTSLEKDNKDS